MSAKNAKFCQILLLAQAAIEARWPFYLARFLESAPVEEGLDFLGSRNQKEVSPMEMRVPLDSATGGFPGITGSPDTDTPFLPITTSSNEPALHGCRLESAFLQGPSKRGLRPSPAVRS